MSLNAQSIFQNVEMFKQKIVFRPKYKFTVRAISIQEV